jgi:hypothetical protein
VRGDGDVLVCVDYGKLAVNPNSAYDVVPVSRTLHARSIVAKHVSLDGTEGIDADSYSSLPSQTDVVPRSTRTMHDGIYSSPAMTTRKLECVIVCCASESFITHIGIRMLTGAKAVVRYRVRRQLASALSSCVYVMRSRRITCVCA